MAQLHITSYVSERLADIARLLKCRGNLLEHLDGKLSNNCVQKNGLNRWERRRTKAVYRYIRGRQWKERARLSNAKRQKVMKNRRHRRYSINNLIFELHNMHSYDHDNIKWLETHKWMRKRLKMKNTWGYCIPVKHMGRGMKSVIRAAESHSIICDMSYIKPIEVLVHDSMDVFLNDIFSEFVDPSCSFLAVPTDAEYTELSLLVYSRGSFPHNCYGPIKICYLPSASIPSRQDKIWIWTHPSFYADFLDELQQCVDDYYSSQADEGAQKIIIQNITSGMNRFSIIGASAASLIAKAFTTRQSSSAHSTEAFYEKIINSEGLLRVWQNGQILGINCADHRYPREHDTRNSSRRSYERLVWPNTNASSLHSDLWDDQNRARASSIFLPDHQLNMRRKMLNNSRIHLKSLSSTTINGKVSAFEQAALPLLIIRNDLANHVHATDTKSIQGWDIIVPSRWGASIFNHLHLLGGRVVGVEEIEYLQTYYGHISFPRDFPDTKVGEMYWLDKSIDRNKKIQLRDKCKPTRATKSAYSSNSSDINDESDDDDDDDDDNDDDDNDDDDYDDDNDDNNNDDDDDDDVGAISHCSGSKMAMDEVQDNSTGFNDKIIANLEKVAIASEESVRNDNYFKDFVIVRGKEYLESFNPLLPNSEGINVNPLPELPFSTLVTVLLRRVGRCMPATGAAIYSPLLNDYRLYVHYNTNKTKRTSLRGTRLGKWTGVELNNISTPCNSHIFSSGTKNIEGEDGSRVLLGYVTAGNQYQYRFSDKAIGICDITKLHKSYLTLIDVSSSLGKTHCEHGCGLILYRNPNSKWLRPALSGII